MTKESIVSLIAATALFGIGTLSIERAFDGRIAFNDQPDAMVTQLYASDPANTDVQTALLSSSLPPSGYHVSR